MNSLVLVNIMRFLGLLFLQVLVFRQFIYGPFSGAYITVYIYPLFLLLLPYRTSTELLLFIAFGTGFAVDWFYDTLGMHASASLLTALLRPWWLERIKPRNDYGANKGLTPTHFGYPWFFRYITALLLVHLLWLSMLEVFSFSGIFTIFLKTTFSVPISLGIIFILMVIFKPRN